MINPGMTLFFLILFFSHWWQRKSLSSSLNSQNIDFLFKTSYQLMGYQFAKGRILGFLKHTKISLFKNTHHLMMSLVERCKNVPENIFGVQGVIIY